jgi:hypothetical protein
MKLSCKLRIRATSLYWIDTTIGLSTTPSQYEKLSSFSLSLAPQGFDWCACNGMYAAVYSAKFTVHACTLVRNITFEVCNADFTCRPNAPSRRAHLCNNSISCLTISIPIYLFQENGRRRRYSEQPTGNSQNSMHPIFLRREPPQTALNMDIYVAACRLSGTTLCATAAEHR